VLFRSEKEMQMNGVEKYMVEQRKEIYLKDVLYQPGNLYTKNQLRGSNISVWLLVTKHISLKLNH